MWRLCENGQICNSCYEENKKQLLNELEPETPDPGNENTNCKKGCDVHANNLLLIYWINYNSQQWWSEEIAKEYTYDQI